MKTKNLIQLNANVIKITNLTKGDVFKMIETSQYSNPEIKYGVVIDLMNDGDSAFVETLIYTKTYDDVRAEVKIIKGDEDISIFPCQLDEVKEYLENSIDNLNSKIEEKKVELHKLILSTSKARAFVNGETSKELKEVEYKEITQKEFNGQKKEKEQKIKELTEEEEF